MAALMFLLLAKRDVFVFVVVLVVLDKKGEECVAKDGEAKADTTVLSAVATRKAAIARDRDNNIGRDDEILSRELVMRFD
jgi:hypothetical protein